MEAMQLQSIVLYLEQKGLSDIRVEGIKNRKSPLEVKLDENPGIVPSITARHYESHYIYEIEDCAELNEEQVVAKWKLFEEYTRKKRGRLCLIIPVKWAKEVQRILDDNGIDASLLKMKSM